MPVQFNPIVAYETANSVSYALWYVGRIVVSHRQAPPTLIDDSVERFENLSKRLDLERQLKGQRCEKVKRHRTELTIQIAAQPEAQEEEPVVVKANSFDNTVTVHDEVRERSISSENGLSVKLDFGNRPRSASDGDKTKQWMGTAKEPNSLSTPQTHRRTASFGGEATRNVIFRITPQCVTLINEMTKAILMEKKLREISFCQQVCGFYCN